MSLTMLNSARAGLVAVGKLPAMIDREATLRATSSRPVRGDIESPPLDRRSASVVAKPSDMTVTEPSSEAASRRRYMATDSSICSKLLVRA